MSIATVVTLGFGNGTLTGSVAGVVLLGFTASPPDPSPFVRIRGLASLGDLRGIEALGDQRGIYSLRDHRRIDRA